MDPERIGPYRIDGRLGAGGMGLVWAAIDERLGRRVAIKCLTPDHEASTEHRERLRREARALAAVHHPDVAQVYDLVEEGDALYVVMERVDGDTLGARLLAGRLPPADAARIGARIARALAAVHARRLVHRDLKADNVIVGADGDVTVVDFGLVKRFDPDRSEASLTSDGVVMGTSRAMSPEQATGGDVDHRSDLFALGSLLYEMLSGRHPFQSSTPMETMERVVRHRPAPLERLVPDVPPELAGLVDRLLEKKPSRRPQRADDVAAALERLASDDATRPPLPAGADGRRRTRRWVLGGVAALAAAAALAVWWWSRPADAPPVVVVAAGETADGWGPLLDAAVLQMSPGYLGSRTAVDWCGADDVTVVAAATRADEVLRIRIGVDGGRLLERWWAGPQRRIADVRLGDRPSPAAAAAAVEALYPGSDIDPARLPSAPVDDLVTLDRLRTVAHDAVFVDELEAVVAGLSTLRARRPRLVEAQLVTATAAARLVAEWGVPGAAETAADAVVAARAVAPDDPRVASAAAEAALAVRAIDRAEDALASSRHADTARRWWSARLAAARGDVDRALELVAEAGPLPTPWALEAAGWELSAGRLADAHARLSAAASLAPRSRRVRTALIAVELVRGDTGRALEVADGVVGLEALARAAVALDLGRPDLALAALDGEPAGGRPSVGALRCVALVSMGRAGDATREAASVLARWSGPVGGPPPEADPVTAPLLAAAGRAPEARAAVQRLVARSDRHPLHLATGAWASAVAGGPVTAAVLADRAVDAGLDPRWRSLMPTDSVPGE